MEKLNEEILQDDTEGRDKSLDPKEESSIEKEIKSMEELEVEEIEIVEDLEDEASIARSSLLDKEIEEALERDKLESAEMSKTTFDTEYVSDVAIYEDEEELSELNINHEKKLEKKENKFKLYVNTASQGVSDKFNKLSRRTTYIVAGSLLGGVIVLGVSSVLLAKTQSAKSERILSHTISKPRQTYNNLNYAFVEDEVNFEDSSLILNKVLIDDTSTIFYFNKHIDEKKYRFSLTDNNGRRYSLDLPNVIQKGIVNDGNPTVLKFEALGEKVKSIDLKLINIETKEETVFYFLLDKEFVSPSPKYLTTPIQINTNIPSLEASIENAVFSSSGTNITFKLKWKEDSEAIQIGNEHESEIISLREGAKAILPKSSVHKYYFDEEKTILGSLEFGPIRNLDSKLDLKFKDIYRKFYVEKDIPVSTLFDRTGSSSEILQLNNYKVVLEAMGRQGSKYILTAHTEDTGVLAYSKSSNKFNNLVTTMIEAQLVCESTNGVEIIIDGKNTSGDIGSDIVFDTSEVEDLMHSVPLGNMKLRIKSVMLKIDEVDISLDLSKVKYHKDRNTKDALDSVISAFKSRLSYKLGEVDKNNIKFFSQEVLSDSKLMKNYEKVNLTEPSFYDAQVVSYSIEDEKFIGVIAEYWEIIEDDEFKEFFRSHKVIAERNDQGEFIITSDTIIN